MSACEGISPEAAALVKLMLSKESPTRPSAADVLGNPWFATTGRVLNRNLSVKFDVVTLKGRAHSIFLEAMTMKLHREHYSAAAKVFNERDSNYDGHMDLPEFL